jgi:ubiquinone/menaquinone biosynthesis C-methylase UbiE
MNVDVYEQNPEGYDGFQTAFLMHNELAGRIYRGLFEGVALAPGQRIAEIGVGTGMNLPFYPEGAEVVGLDRSEGMLARARTRAAEARAKVTLVKVDAAKIDFPDESFDRIVVTFVLCSCEDPGGVLKEALRLLRRGGRVGLFDYQKAKSNPDILADQMFLRETMKNGLLFQGRAVIVCDSLYDLDDHLPGLPVKPLYDERIERSFANSFRAVVLEKT